MDKYCKYCGTNADGEHVSDENDEILFKRVKTILGVAELSVELRYNNLILYASDGDMYNRVNEKAINFCPMCGTNLKKVHWVEY